MARARVRQAPGMCRPSCPPPSCPSLLPSPPARGQLKGLAGPGACVGVGEPLTLTLRPEAPLSGAEAAAARPHLDWKEGREERKRTDGSRTRGTHGSPFGPGHTCDLPSLPGVPLPPAHTPSSFRGFIQGRPRELEGQLPSCPCASFPRCPLQGPPRRPPAALRGDGALQGENVTTFAHKLRERAPDPSHQQPPRQCGLP